MQSHEFIIEDLKYKIIRTKEPEVTVLSAKNKSVITIPKYVNYKGIDYKVVSINCRAFEFCSMLTRIDLPDSISVLKEKSFLGCHALTEINIPSSVTKIENSAFKGCTSLNNIHIPESVTSLGDEVFYGCSSLSEITLPESITIINKRTFLFCI